MNIKNLFYLSLWSAALAVSMPIYAKDKAPVTLASAEDVANVVTTLASGEQRNPADWLEKMPKDKQNALEAALKEVTKGIDKLPPKERQEKLMPYLKASESITISDDKPLTNKVAKQLLMIEHAYWDSLSNEELIKAGPHRLASCVGIIPSDARATKVTARIKSNPDKFGKWWNGEPVSTGAYALPGQPLKLTVPKEWIDKGLELQIGHHNNAPEDRPWVSMPVVSKRIPITKATDTYITPHGGLIHIRVPSKLGLKAKTVTLENVLKTPSFVLGKTSDEEWMKIHHNPAPWGELISDSLIMIVDRDNLQRLTNPTALMTWWNDTNKLHQDFYDYKPGYAFRMHGMLYAREGYAYAPLEWNPKNMRRLLDVNQMKKTHDGLYLHEHGHHGDFGEMIIGFTGESTCNWIGYYLKSLTPFDWKDSHDTHLKKLFDTNDAAHNEIKQKEWYKISNKGTHHWSYPVTSMMIGYAEDFDWKTLRKFFHRYRDFKGDSLNQHAFLKDKFDDQGKIDRYLIGLSEEAKRDVRPYFAHFDYNPSEGAAKHIDSLKLKPWDNTYLPLPESTETPMNTPYVIEGIHGKLLSMAKGSKFILEGQPKNGKVTLDDKGTLTYTPKKGFKGKDNFKYSLQNDVGTSPTKSFTITVK